MWQSVRYSSSIYSDEEWTILFTHNVVFSDTGTVKGQKYEHRLQFMQMLVIKVVVIRRITSWRGTARSDRNRGCFRMNLLERARTATVVNQYWSHQKANTCQTSLKSCGLHRQNLCCPWLRLIICRYQVRMPLSVVIRYGSYTIKGWFLA